MKTLIAIPCMDTVPVDFMTSLINLRKGADTSYAVQPNSLIYDSRNGLSAKALMNGYDRVLWLDSDMVFDADLLERLSVDMEKQNLDYVCGLFFMRHIPTGPCVYSDIIYRAEEDHLHSEAVQVKEYPPDRIFEIKGSGFGAVLMKTEVLKDVWEHYGPPFDPMTQLGEDLSFCWRVSQLGHRMWCDPGIKVGHCGQYVYSEKDYKIMRNA